ncbi:MAG: hypothetical protein ABI615_13115 [Chthoniobacterales bacterium]
MKKIIYCVALLTGPLLHAQAPGTGPLQAVPLPDPSTLKSLKPVVPEHTVVPSMVDQLTKTLDLTSDQITKTSLILEERRTTMKLIFENQSLTPQQRTDQTLTAMQIFEEQLNAFLTDEQRAKQLEMLKPVVLKSYAEREEQMKKLTEIPPANTGTK